MKRILPIVILVVCLSAKGADLAVGSAVPDIEARLLDGSRTVQLSANRGKVTIVNFWATWCVPCRAEMPAIQAYYDKHKGQGLEILAISMDDARNLAEVKKVAQNFTFPIALKSEANFKGLGRIWRMPSTFVIDKNGILRKNGHVGDAEIDLSMLESLVTPLLNAQ
jgi:cytochrome c biogenesis protein CcmG, thiol:disulfide interchange protein DsbE